jgi:RNA polymerase sigma-70 factor (ECF subfamily)
LAISPEDLLRLILRERDGLYAYVWSMLRDDDLAEDVFQDICALAMQKSETIGGSEHLAGWFRIAARNRCREVNRSRRRRPLPLDEHLLDALDVHWSHRDLEEGIGRSEALRKCLQKLNTRGLELLKMRYVSGLKSSEIARRLNRNVQSVYVNLTRLHTSLRECVRRHLHQTEMDL